MPRISPDPPECPKPNLPGCAWIPVNAWKGKWEWALVDEADEEWARTYKWGLGKDGYAYRQKSWRETDGKRQAVGMHRELAGNDGTDLITDHVNRERLDNRRSNLRSFDNQGEHLQNQCKRVETARSLSSPYRGVSLYTMGNYVRWRARCTVDGKEYSGGYHRTPEEARDAVEELYRKHMPFAA